MGTVSITGIKPGSTSLKLTAGTVTKIIPIAVTAAPGLSALTITATAKQGGGYTVEDSKAPASDETRRYMVTSASESRQSPTTRCATGHPVGSTGLRTIPSKAVRARS